MEKRGGGREREGEGEREELGGKEREGGGVGVLMSLGHQEMVL